MRHSTSGMDVAAPSVEAEQDASHLNFRSDVRGLLQIQPSVFLKLQRSSLHGLQGPIPCRGLLAARSRPWGLRRKNRFLGESAGGSNFGIVRWARTSRRVLISEPRAHVVLPGDIRRGDGAVLTGPRRARTTGGRHDVPIAANLLGRNVTAAAPKRIRGATWR